MKNLILCLVLCCVVGVTLGNIVPVCNNIYDDDASITVPLCDKWAHVGECINNRDWMSQFCRKSCRLCGISSESTTTTTTTTQAPTQRLPSQGPPGQGPRVEGPIGLPLPLHHPTHHHPTDPPTLPRTPMVLGPPAGCRDPAMATCDMRCSAGHKTDANGCPLCECLPEMCEGVTCKPGETCRVRPCFQHPCEKTDTECIEITTTTTTTTQAQTHRLPSQAPPGQGPRAGGPLGLPLPLNHPTHHHFTHPPTLPRTPMMWVPPAGCKDPAMATCDMRCSAGHKTDANGCPLCECLPEMCEAVTCKQGETCRMRPCFQHPCEKTDTECIVDSMCNFDRAHQADYHKHMCSHKKNMTAMSMKPHLPECGKEGHYNPLQCHNDETTKVKDCWCVTNFGAEIEGTRVPVEAEADLPDCIEQHTFALLLSFGLYHDLGDDVHHHMQGIQKSVEVQLTLWMEVKEGDVIHVEVFPLPGQYLVVYVSIIDQSFDLADAANKLDRHLHVEGVTIKYQDTELTPDTDSVSFKHKDVPDREEEWGPYAKRNFRACYRKHPILVVVVSVILGLFVLALPIVIMAICRRRKRNNQFSHKPLNEKSQNYKENIAFGNNLCDVKQDEKKVPI